MREAREGPTTARALGLWVLVGLLALLCAVGGLQVWRVRDARAVEGLQYERYGEVLAAAADEADAFVNVDHHTAEEDLTRIGAGATGPLRERYTEDLDRLVRSVRRDELVTEGEVLWSGVVRVDSTSATVLVATTGTRSDRSTDGPVARNLRLRLQLVRVDGRWLTSRIEQVD